jgi:16S rRNA G527 N7-methylase RsmG
MTTTQIPEQRQNLVDIFLEKNSQINLSAIRDAD